MVILPFTSRRATVDRQSFDRAYLERLRQGDAETERNFYAYFGELIRIKARARGRVETDDIRQETFLRVLRTLRAPDGLRDPGALGAFVNSVCTNVLRESVRSLKRYDEGQDDPDSIPDPAAPGPDTQLLAAEREQAVLSVLRLMPQRDCDLLRAIFFDERDKKRVCEEFGVSRDYLRVLVHRAKNLFRTIYQEREEALSRAAGPKGVRRTAGGAVVW
jgi:RNA polymerase sigma-70 factor (ECF subfamily)